MEGDIVERLRWESNGVTVNLNPWPTMREAADAIALCRARVAELEDGRLRALLAATVGNPDGHRLSERSGSNPRRSFGHLICGECYIACRSQPECLFQT
jgi:hypothetical protein